MTRQHSFTIEPLESRQLLHGAPGLGGLGPISNSLEFDQTLALVQSGLESLATKDGLATPTATSTQSVSLGNSNGVETYTIVIRGTGTVSRLTVDQNGKPVTSPTRTTTTWDTFSAANAVAAGEISAIATALSLTAPATTTNVAVSTPADGSAASYTVRLAPTSGKGRSVSITVDASGNPVGNESVPFSAMPTAIQTGLNNLAPSGATKLDTTSTQRVRVQTIDGVVIYSTSFTSSGTNTSVAVDATGATATLPSRTTANFSTIPSAARGALQSLATEKGSTDTIADTATTQVSTEANGTVIYTVTVSVTSTDSRGNSHTRNVAISVDASGNPTVPSSTGFFGGGGFGAPFGGSFGGGCGR